MTPGFAQGDFLRTLWVSALMLVLLFAVTFAVASWRGRHSVLDVAWGSGFVVVAAVAALSGGGDGARRALVLVLTALWGLRLATHIALRNRLRGEDPRYAERLDKAKASRTAYAIRMLYTPQAVAVWLVSLPLQVAMNERRPLGTVAWLGVLVWLVGVVFETVGDRQLEQHKADPSRRGTVLDTGLWRYTRHPNYFGDACVWWGLWLVAAEQWQGWPVILAPLVMTLVLTRGTGAGETERRMKDRAGFADYVARTSGFVPLPPRERRT